jgi:hypothetical protein
MLKQINMDDIELRLLVGLPVEIESVGYIYSPLVKETISIGQNTYSQYLSLLLVDKEKISSTSKTDDISTFDVILSLYIHDRNFSVGFIKALEFLFRENVSFGYTDSEAFFYLGGIEDKRYITKNNIELIQAVVRVANQVKVADEEEEQYNPADEQARKIIEEMLARRKNKPKPKPTMNLHSIISGLASKSSSINHLNVGDLSIYQLYDNFYRLEVIENYHYTLVGIYTGNVDSKKINFKNIHWTKIIEQ